MITVTTSRFLCNHPFALKRRAVFPGPAALVLQLLLTACILRPAAAVEETQSLKLSYGWNAVWLEVAPLYAVNDTVVNDPLDPADDKTLAIGDPLIGQPKAAQDVFRAAATAGFTVDQVARLTGSVGTAEFTSNPDSQFNQGGWDVWHANPPSGETDAVVVHGNHAYLVHVEPNTGVTARDGDLADAAFLVRGEVVFDQPSWDKGGYNLVGFSVLGAPTFTSLFASSGIVVDGPLNAPANVQKLDPGTGNWVNVKGSEAVMSGVAYWINVPHSLPGRGWAGPVETDFSGAISGSLDFGSGPGSLPVVINPVDPDSTALVSSTELTFSSLEKAGGPQHQVTISRIFPGASTDDGLQFLALEPVPLTLQWTTQTVDFAAGWQAATLTPGASQSVTVGVRRNWTTGFRTREHLYRVAVSLSGGSVYRYLPVSATNAELPADPGATPPASAFTGLWFGQIALNAVTSLGTDGTPVQATAGELPLHVFIHVDADGEASLVPRSILMQTKTASDEVEPSLVLVVNEERIPFFEGVQQRADGLRVGVRLETASFDLPRDLRADHLPEDFRKDVANAQGIADPASVTDEDVAAYLGKQTSRPPSLPETYHLTWPLEGQLGVGHTVETSASEPLTLDAFHRSNPFRHAFHPQHGTGYAITRHISISVDAAPDATILTGTYQETTSGLARQDIVSRGRISLRRVTTADTLQ